MLPIYKIQNLMDGHGINYTVIKNRIIAIEYTGVTDLTDMNLTELLTWLGY